MKTRIQELELARGVWQQAAERLERRLAGHGKTPRSHHDDDEPEPETTLAELRTRLMVYHLCIDWAMGQQDLLNGWSSDSQTLQRDRFYRLMTVLAKAEIDRDDHVRATAFVSSRAIEHATNQQAVDELQLAASAALQRLLHGEAAGPAKGVASFAAFGSGQSHVS